MSSNILAAWGSAFADGIAPEMIADGIRALARCRAVFSVWIRGSRFSS